MLASGRCGFQVIDQLTLGEGHQGNMMQEWVCISWAGCLGLLYSRFARSTTGFLKPLSFLPLDVFSIIPRPAGELTSQGTGDSLPATRLLPPSGKPLPLRTSSHLFGTRVLAGLSYSCPSCYFSCSYKAYSQFPANLLTEVGKKNTYIL